ncbi:hypothetical protein CS805_004851 [Escherichia coli]|nr:hypothetical protein [Escherichia coli]
MDKGICRRCGSSQTSGIMVPNTGCIKFINPASKHITTGITQSPAGKRQAAAVVKIMFNGNLFLHI